MRAHGRHEVPDAGPGKASRHGLFSWLFWWQPLLVLGWVHPVSLTIGDHDVIVSPEPVGHADGGALGQEPAPDSNGQCDPMPGEAASASGGEPEQQLGAGVVEGVRLSSSQMIGWLRAAS